MNGELWRGIRVDLEEAWRRIRSHREWKVPSKIADIPTSSLLWILAAFVTVIAFSYSEYGDGGKRFIDVSPHPFWVLILYGSFRYGTNGGLVVVSLSTLFLLVGNLPEQTYGMNLHELQLAIVGRPFLWFVTGLFLGEMRTKQKMETQHIQQELEQVKTRELSITEAYQALDGIKIALERQLTGQTTGSITSYEAMKNFETLEPLEILMNTIDIVLSVLRVDKLSVFSHGENGFEVINAHGWKEEDQFNRRIRNSSKLFQEVGGKRRIVCCINYEDEELLGVEGMIAGPIVDPRNSHLVGLLKIEQIDHNELTASTVETFKVLCDWAGAAYAQAVQYQTVQSDQLHNADTGLYSLAYGQLMASYFMDSVEPTEGEGMILELTFQNARKFKPNEKLTMVQAVKTILEEVAPRPFWICGGRSVGKEFFLILPNASLQIAESLGGVIQSRLMEYPNEEVNRAIFLLSAKPLV